MLCLQHGLRGARWLSRVFRSSARVCRPRAGGEPWDMDELHDMDNHDYKAATERFRNLGCNAWSNTDLKCSSAMVDPDMAAHAEAVQGMLEYPDEWIY